MQSREVLRLGTRRSLLAWAQSGQVAREIERLNPGLRVELVGIDTRGDKIQDVPLRAVEGKEFFVAELDEALRSGAVDLSVHSMKDLSLERPRAFVRAAIPPRQNPRDVVLFGPGVVEAIRTGRALKIGTSSPRRLENLPPFLERALPRFSSGAPRLELVEIRGNVNTRLSRVHEPHGSERHLDGVVLAFAGLARLWMDEKGRPELHRLLTGVRWMVLPLRDCPAAAAQGALAIECRADDAFARSALAKLHDRDAEAQVSVERGLLEDWGGGCHQRFGGTCVVHPELGQLFFVRGVKPDGAFVDELRWRAPAKPVGPVRPWDGSEHRGKTQSLSVSPRALEGHDAVFVAHSRAVPEGWEEALERRRVWVSGTQSWFRLAERGIWVEGSAESLGVASLEATLRAPVLRLPAELLTLTHEGAPGLATYRVERLDDGPDLAGATHLFWSSGSQFDALAARAPAGARHACGPGRTAQRLRERGAKFDVFPSVKEWRLWLSG